MYSDNSKRHEAGTSFAGGESDIGPIPEDKVALMPRLHGGLFTRSVAVFCSGQKKPGRFYPARFFYFLLVGELNLQEAPGHAERTECRTE